MSGKHAKGAPPSGWPYPPSPACAGPLLRIERNDHGLALRVFLGTVDITHLVARVQTNTTMLGTCTEVVLVERNSAPTLEAMQ